MLWKSGPNLCDKIVLHIAPRFERYVLKAETFSFQQSIAHVYGIGILWINTELSIRGYQGDQQLNLLQSLLKERKVLKTPPISIKYFIIAPTIVTALYITKNILHHRLHKQSADYLLLKSSWDVKISLLKRIIKHCFNLKKYWILLHYSLPVVPVRIEEIQSYPDVTFNLKNNKVGKTTNLQAWKIFDNSSQNNYLDGENSSCTLIISPKSKLASR